MGYFIMPKYDANLFKLMEQHNGLKRLEIILSVSYQLVGIMQLIHKLGRTYNDMKPHNVMVSGPSHDVTLVDFGFASKYTDDT